MNKQHKSYYFGLLIGWLFMMVSCQPNPSPILHKAMEMDSVSTDSVFFYLQQIEQPHRLPDKEQGDYCLLVYKATLDKTGEPNDSLLNAAIRHYEKNRQSSQLNKAHLEQCASYLYRKLPDSTLVLSNQLLNREQLNDSLRLQLYALRRVVYFRKKNYGEALAMADSCRQLALRMKDTATYFWTARIYFQIAERMQEHERYVQGSQQLIGELRNSPNYQSFIYYIFEDLVNHSIEKKDFQQASFYLEQLSREKHSRNEIPRYLLLRGKAHAALNELDSAKYYYEQAAASSSDYVAMEANALLFNLIEKEYPERAFYTKQKGHTIRNNVQNTIQSEIQQREFKEIKLKNELFLSHLAQQRKELWMMGIVITLLSVGFIAFFFYQREKKKRLQRENQLLHKEAELRELREKEISLRGKEAELRAALFRRISFFHKLPSLHTYDGEDNYLPNRKIVVTEAEWTEVTSAINDAFDNFVARLRQAYPLLLEKEIGFCCLVKINVNIQDLSDIYCVSKAAITKRKYRIKTDKLGITDENISLDSYLKAF